MDFETVEVRLNCSEKKIKNNQQACKPNGQKGKDVASNASSYAIKSGAGIITSNMRG